MNRSFRAQDSLMPSIRPRIPQLRSMRSTATTREKEDDLALFLEMRKRDKEKNDLLLDDSEELNETLALQPGSSPLFNVSSSVPARKPGADDFLNSDSDKNDYDWLLTPPGTPLFPSLEMESTKTYLSETEAPKARPTALQSRLANSQSEVTMRSSLPSPSPALSSSSTGMRRPSSSGGPGSRPVTPSGSRPATPTGRLTATTSSRPSRSSTPTARSTLPSRPSVSSTRSTTTPRSGTPTRSSVSTGTTRSTPAPRSSTPTRSSVSTGPSRSTPAPRSSTPTRSSVSTGPSRSSVASRSSTPTRSTVSSASTRTTAAPRSVTPTRPTARPSTPTSRSSVPTSRPTPRPSTPTRRPSTPSNIPAGASALLSKSSSSINKSGPSGSTQSRNPKPSHGTSPTVNRSRPWKPSEMPGFSLDAPPNLRTTLPDRPLSATRGRPGVPSPRSSSVEPAANGRQRQQSRSPSRGRAPNGSTRISGSSVPAVSRGYSRANEEVSPVVVGNKMVERVINMRRLAPPRQEEKHSPSLSGKSASSPDSSGFGRSLSKKSLDMAIRHMDIRRTIPGNLRPLMTNIPASSMYSVRSGPPRSRTASVSDSPLATSSNASSEFSVNNHVVAIDGSEPEDDHGSERGERTPVAGLQGR